MKKVLLLFMLLLPLTGFSQQIQNTIVQPSSSATGMEIIANMMLVHRPAWPHGSTVQLRNDTLFLKACYYEGIQATPIQFTDTFQVGNLAQGQYTLHFTMIKTYNHLQCDSVNSDIKTSLFTVNEATGIAPAPIASALEIYPNPADDVVWIESSPLKQITLRDLSGKLIQTNIYQSETSTKLDISPLPKGFYLLETTTRNGKISRQRLLKN